MQYKDFTLNIYRELLEIFLRKNYKVISSENFFVNEHLPDKIIILRHDVDRLPQFALKRALLKNALNIKGSYYFRVVKESFNKSNRKNCFIWS